MDYETFSLLVWCKRDLSSDFSSAPTIRVMRVDTGEEVPLKDGDYLLRLSTDTDVIRCLVRHLASGREVYIQSGRGLPDFVKACLVQGSEAPPEVPETTGETAGKSEAEGDNGNETRV